MNKKYLYYTKISKKNLNNFEKTNVKNNLRGKHFVKVSKAQLKNGRRYAKHFIADLPYS